MEVNKKQKKMIPIIFLVGFVLIIGLNYTGFDFATLYGGTNDNQYGGEFSTSAINQNGDTITSFAEIPATQIDLSITNNANSPFIATGLPSMKKIPITITSTADVTDYQVKIPIPHQTGMEDDFSNIRFQLADGTDLPQWKESFTSATTSDYWIKTDLITGDNVVYMVYGGVLPLKSNPSAVYEFYDNFNDLSQWTQSGTGTAIVTDGILDVYNSGSSKNVWSTQTFTSGIIFESRHKFGEDILGLRTENEDDGVFFYNSGSLDRIYAKTSVSQTSPDTTHITDEFVTRKIIWESDKVSFFENDIEIPNSPIVTNIPSVPLKIDIRAVNDHNYVDWIRVRKYISSEPTITIGTPEDITPSFTKRQTITIDNSAGAELVDAQILETITFDADMQTDMDDIIFTELDGTIIPHYTEAVTDSTSADVWLKISVPTTSLKNIYMYYGNSELPDISCTPSEMFDFYQTGDSSKWSGTYDYIGSDYIQVSNGDAITSVSTFSLNSIIEYEFRRTDDMNSKGSYISAGFGNVAQSEQAVSQIYWSSDYSPAERYNVYALTSSASTSSDIIQYSKNTWYGVSIARTTTPEVIWERIGIDSGIISSNIPTDNLPIFIGARSGFVETGEIRNIKVRQYIASKPTISFGTETSLVNPTITTSCTGDSNSQTYGLETKDFSITPTSVISQFDISGSIDYNFDATVHYSDATTSIVQNATEGTMSIAFTPIVALESGYVNGVFTEDITIENPSISATIDDEATTDVVLENNNTISVQLPEMDVSEHIVNVTITKYVAPSTPSSGGSSGGSSYIPPVEKTIEETTTDETGNIDNNIIVSNDISRNESYLFGFVFVILLVFGYLFYKRK